MDAYLEISNQYSAISVETNKSDDVTIHIADRVSNTGNGITLTAEQDKVACRYAVWRSSERHLKLMSG